MLPTLLRRLHDFSRRLIVRVLLIALCSVLAIAVAKLVGHSIPFGLKDRIGAEAVDRILSIIANSMLTVTTFSLTVMVSSHMNVSSLWTPRAHQVLLQDTTTHTVLATFVGAYIYSLIAIVLRETEVFKGEELVVLFFMTLLVVALIVVAILRWISHLELLGTLISTSQTIEDKAQAAYRTRCDHPALGGKGYDKMPDVTGWTPVPARTSGYVQQIYQDRIQDLAEEAGVEIVLSVPVGDFVHEGQPLAWISADAEGLQDRLCELISVGTLRNYEQDPGFGLVNLTEIGQRALSPGINDPGTAVDMIRRIARILMSDRVTEPGEKVLYDRLHVPLLDRSVMLRDSIGAIARHGLAHPEVVRAAHSSLLALKSHGDAGLSKEATRLAEAIEARAETDPITQPG